MAHVEFEVIHTFDAEARVVWDDLVDWKAHEAWIPATRVDVGPGDPTAVGTEFTAYSGFGPLALKDHMAVTACDWDEATGLGRCEVEKLGPVLRGRAWFTVEPDGDGSVLSWYEDVRVRYVPQFVAPVLNRAGAAGFRIGMKRLAKLLSERSHDGAKK